MNIPERIKELREKFKITQKEVSAKTGISESAISRLILKDIQDIDNIYAVCDAIGISPAKILPGLDAQMSQAEADLLREFSRLRPDQQTALIEFLKTVK
jgi:transcriptional regulator with XRE-family HTH domain